jgi:hypothetical protein
VPPNKSICRHFVGTTRPTSGPRYCGEVLRGAGLDNKKPRFPGIFCLPKPSDGLEPSTPSLPSRFGGSWSQPTATILAYFRGFQGRAFATGCHWLRPLGSINAPSSRRESLMNRGIRVAPHGRATELRPLLYREGSGSFRCCACASPMLHGSRLGRRLWGNSRRCGSGASRRAGSAPRSDRAIGRATSRRSCSAAARSRFDRTPRRRSSTGSRPGTTRRGGAPDSASELQTGRTESRLIT